MTEYIQSDETHEDVGKITVDFVTQVFLENRDYWARQLSITFPMPEDEMEDLMQENYLRLLTQYPMYEGRNNSSFKTWAYTVVRNHTINLIRQRSTQGKGVNNEVNMSSIDHNFNYMDSNDGNADVLNFLSTKEDRYDDPEHMLEVQQMYDIVFESLDELPEKMKKAYMMRTIHGSDYQVIADSIGSSYGGVRILVHQARKRIRERMKDLIGDDSRLQEIIDDNDIGDE
jgi:RNA polymerase sigma-70 factor (ECF subfamily)